jgi:uroporphyrinogen-III synthase
VKALTVLNTRPRAQAAELSRLLRQAGFEVVEAPAIDVESAWDAVELEAVRQRLSAGAYAWVVLPSQNAARALAADLRASPSKIICGKATEKACCFMASLALERFGAAAALDALRARLHSGDRVLMPRAAEGRDELLDGLAALGVLLDAPVAYRTVPAPDAAARLAQGGIDVVTLCSPSAVASVAAALARDVLVVCLGQTTAEAAREASLRVAAAATRTSMPALVEAVETLAGARV